jgi:hypothetical protein
VEGARPFSSKRKTGKSGNCWTEILNGSIMLFLIGTCFGQETKWTSCFFYF